MFVGEYALRSRMVRTEALESAVRRALPRLLADPAIVIEMAAVEREFEKLRESQSRLVELYTDGQIEKALLDEKSAELAARRGSPELERARLITDAEPGCDPHDAARTQAAGARVPAAGVGRPLERHHDDARRRHRPRRRHARHHHHARPLEHRAHARGRRDHAREPGPLREGERLGRCGDHQADRGQRLRAQGPRGLGPEDVAAALLFSTANALVQAAMRLLPISHRDAQSVLHRVRDAIADAARVAAGAEPLPFTSFHPLQEIAQRHRRHPRRRRLRDRGLRGAGHGSRRGAHIRGEGRSRGGGATLRTRIEVMPGAELRYDSGLLIPHAGAVLRQHTEIVLHESARASWSESLSFGRLSHDERFQFTRIENELRVVDPAGRVRYERRSDLVPQRDRAALESAVGRFGAVGSMILLGRQPGEEPEPLDPSALPGVYAGTTTLPDGPGTIVHALAGWPQQIEAVFSLARAAWCAPV